VSRNQQVQTFPGSAVEAIESAVAHDPGAPSGEWYVRRGTIWRSDHPVVLAHPEWFCPLGDGPTSPRYMPAPTGQAA
jgi:hypothetical protein